MKRSRFSEEQIAFALRLAADDRAGRERLAHYMLRCPLGLEHMVRVTGQGKVIYLAERKACRRFPKPASPDLVDGVSRNFQVFEALASSPNSPSTSPTPTSISCGMSASTRIRVAASAPRPAATAHAVGARRFRRAGRWRPVSRLADRSCR